MLKLEILSPALTTRFLRWGAVPIDQERLSNICAQLTFPMSKYPTLESFSQDVNKHLLEIASGDVNQILFHQGSANNEASLFMKTVAMRDADPAQVLALLFLNLDQLKNKLSEEDGRKNALMWVISKPFLHEADYMLMKILIGAGIDLNDKMTIRDGSQIAVLEQINKKLNLYNIPNYFLEFYGEDTCDILRKISVEIKIKIKMNEKASLNVPNPTAGNLNIHHPVNYLRNKKIKNGVFFYEHHETHSDSDPSMMSPGCALSKNSANNRNLDQQSFCHSQNEDADEHTHKKKKLN